VVGNRRSPTTRCEMRRECSYLGAIISLCCGQPRPREIPHDGFDKLDPRVTWKLARMTASRRIDGFAELADYAVVSDGRTSALLALVVQVDWWVLPSLDDLPVCGALLDPTHWGFVFVRPESYVSVESHYIGATNVVDTTYTSTRILILRRIVLVFQMKYPFDTFDSLRDQSFGRVPNDILRIWVTLQQRLQRV